MDLTDSITNLQIGHQLPKLTQNFAAIIKDNHTEFIISHFQNNSIYIITQYGKIGNLYSVRTEQIENGVIECDTVYDIKHLFGEDNIEIEAGLRYIIGQLNLKNTLTVSLTLSDYRLETLKLIVQALKNCL